MVEWLRFGKRFFLNPRMKSPIYTLEFFTRSFYQGTGISATLSIFPSSCKASVEKIPNKVGTLRPVIQFARPLPHPSIKHSGQISIIPKPELRGFWGDALTKPQFKVTSAEVVILCQEACVPVQSTFIYSPPKKKKTSLP